MAVIDQILARAGYVKLADYGLALTPEGRIVSLNPPRSSDGFDQRIVGWRPFDPPMAAAPTAPTAPSPMTTRPAPAATAATIVEEADGDDEEWEWQLALARAKAAAVDTNTVRPLRAAPPTPPARVTVARSIAPPPARVARPIAAVPAPAPVPPRAMVPPFVRAPVATPASAASRPAIVVPQPAPRAVSHPRPAPVRAAPLPPPPSISPRAIFPVTPLPPTSPRRFARGTGPVRRDALPAAAVRSALDVGDETSEITADLSDLTIGDVTSVDRVNQPAEALVFAKPSALPRLSARRSTR